MSDGFQDLSLPVSPPVQVPPGTWALQGTRRRGAGAARETYTQAVHGVGKSRKVVTLGWLTEDAAERALVNLRALGGRLALCDVETVKRVAMSRAVVGPDIVEAIEDAVLQAKVDARDYESMTLREYYDGVWWPHRILTVADSTIDREKKLWPSILAALGHVRLPRLDKHGWTQFLGGISAGPTTKRLTQVAYRTSLTYACEDLKAIPSVHRFDKIKGASKPTLPPGEALLPHEVDAIIKTGDDQMHKALTAITFGLGLRPSEPTGKPVFLRDAKGNAKHDESGRKIRKGWQGGLDWSMVAWDREQILVPGTKNGHAEAVVPFLSDTRAYAEMRIWWEECGRPATGLVFFVVHDGMRVGIENWWTSFRAQVRRAKLDPDETRRIIRYSGRYTFATLAEVSGVGEGATRRAMRHSSRSQIMERIYQRLSIGQTAQALRALPAFEALPAKPEPAPAAPPSAKPTKSKTRKATEPDGPDVFEMFEVPRFELA